MCKKKVITQIQQSNHLQLSIRWMELLRSDVLRVENCQAHRHGHLLVAGQPPGSKLRPSFVMADGDRQSVDLLRIVRCVVFLTER